MKLMWLNNVSSLLGGTLQCTLSMSKAFPDCQHVVYSLASGFNDEAKKLFGDNCKMLSKEDGPLREVLFQEEPDILVMQNTSDHSVPNSFPKATLPVYYLHSAFSGAVAAFDRFPTRFCVSKYLARTVKASEDTVLHQPVHCPPPASRGPSCNYAITIGRICTPKLKKWEFNDLFPLYDKLNDSVGEHVWFEFVGCPDFRKEGIENALDDHVSFIEPSYKARENYWNWDIMLYHSSLKESYGRVVIEAQRANCIPVVTNHGGFKEQIIHDDNGFLCNDVDGFVETVEELFNCDEYRERIKGNAKRTGELRGSLHTWRTKFLNKIETQLNS